MSIPAQSYVAIGTISAALIAGGISFLVTVLSKDQKTSEFRQAWINDLRNNIADLISHFHVTRDYVVLHRSIGMSEAELITQLATKVDLFTKFEMVDAKIRLLINPDEHTKLVGILDSLQDFTMSDLEDEQLANNLVKDLIAEGQQILKREWKRVKRGEIIFVVTKYSSLVMLVSAVTLLILYVNGYIQVKFIS